MKKKKDEANNPMYRQTLNSLTLNNVPKSIDPGQLIFDHSSNTELELTSVIYQDIGHIL